MGPSRVEKPDGPAAGSVGGGFHIRDVDLQLGLAFVFHRSGADDWNNRQNRAAHHRFLEVLSVIFGKGGHLFLEYRQLLIGPRFESVEALANVSKKARLRVFAVSYDLDPALHLLAHTVGDRLCQNGIQLALVVGLARILGLQQIKQIVRPWQAADMRRLNVIGILL